MVAANTRGITVLTGNGKGGVGKSSTVINSADLLADRGYRVLIIDSDVQGDCALMLGVEAEAQEDGGDAMLDLVRGKPPTPLRDVRPKLDLIPSGPDTDTARLLMESRTDRDGLAEVGAAVAAAVHAVAADYDFVLIDTPPAKQSSRLLDVMLAASDFLTIPFKHDVKSLSALPTLFKRVEFLREYDFPIQVAGALFFDIDTAARRISDDTSAYLREQLGEDIPVFNARIRHLTAADSTMGWQALTIREYAALASHEDAAERAKVSRAAPGLLADYEAYVDELLAVVGA